MLLKKMRKILLDDHFQVEERVKCCDVVFKSKMSFKNCNILLDRCSVPKRMQPSTPPNCKDRILDLNGEKSGF